MIHAQNGRAVPETRLESSVDLLRRAQSGDADALNQLLRRYLPRLRRWASSRLPWALRSMLDTGDLVQDAVVSSLPHLPALEVRSERALEFYLKRAIRNRILDLRRRSGRRPVREELPGDVVDRRTSSPFDIQSGKEAAERYRLGIAALTKEQRWAIVLRVERGLSYDQIAVELGKSSADAARMIVSRALVRLASRMGEPDRPD